MEVTEVRIKLCPARPGNRLLAYAAVTFDRAFVVYDLKVIDGPRGAFVAMPARQLVDRCPDAGCSAKTPYAAAFCWRCGRPLARGRAPLQPGSGKPALWADVAHPLTRSFRGVLEDAVVAAYERELELAKRPGYVCRYDEYGPAGTE